MIWLIFSKNNNKNYINITIDYDDLQTLPIDGSIYKSLQQYDVDNSDINDDKCADEVGAPQENATGPLPEEENINIFESFAFINLLH